MPEYVLDEAPSPDLFKGVGDEDFISHFYEAVDKVAYVVEVGLNEGLAIDDGVTRKELNSIKRLHELSA